MLNSRLVTTFALFLALAYALPALCVAPAAADQVPATPCGGCHSHHQHTPAPQRYCCANPQAPAALQASASPVPLSLVCYRDAEELAGHPGFATVIPVRHTDFSSSPPAVLRI
jgi:hypothetical protein